ncbi:MAG: hypothetical protein ACT4RN_20850 [Pseudonocardia sp.]
MVAVVDTRRAVHVLHEDRRAEAAGLLATSYRLAAGLAGRIGLTDLAAHAAHRALDAGRHTNRPELDEAAALRYLAWVLIRQGDLAAAEQLAVRAAERLDTGLLTPTEADRVGVFGSLLFNAATAAARSGNGERADELHRIHLAAACADLTQWSDVLDHLDAASRMAPEWARVQPLGRTVASQLIEHRGRRSDRLSRVAAYYETAG